MSSAEVDKMSEPIKVVIVGMGYRAMTYAKESLKYPELFRIVGVVDINDERIALARETFDIPQERCFHSVQDLCQAEKFADAAINGTLDYLHVQTTIPLLEKGYDVLLEKPFAVNQKEADELLACAMRTGRKVMVCHVLRYTPFYREIKRILESGIIGRVINILMSEQVSYFHESVSYVRGKYSSPDFCGSGMLLAKCSHDLDLMAWLMKGNLPRRISSYGGRSQFLSRMAPEGAGTYCMVDCQVERDCIYSAKRLYIENPQRWANNIWHDLGLTDLSDEEKEASLRSRENPFGRCAYRTDMRVVDHQAVMVEFEDGATGLFSMNGGASASGRNIHITGTKGEIIGTFEDEKFTVHCILPENPGGRGSYVVDVSADQRGNVHGNGDEAVIHDFIRMLQGEKPSSSTTLLQDSVVGHRIVFLAEQSREKKGEVQRY